MANKNNEKPKTFDEAMSKILKAPKLTEKQIREIVRKEREAKKKKSNQ